MRRMEYILKKRAKNKAKRGPWTYNARNIEEKNLTTDSILIGRRLPNLIGS